MRAAVREDDDDEYGESDVDTPVVDTFGAGQAFTMPGVPFLDTQSSFASLFPNARIAVEVCWKSDIRKTLPDFWIWSDITSDVQVDSGKKISIQPLGATDWNNTAPPAICSFTLDNRLASYAPWNPGSANFAYLRPGVPVRVSIYLDGSIGTSGINGARYTRFQGTVKSWAEGFDSTGGYAVTAVTAAGSLQRIGVKSNQPARSALYREAMNPAYDVTRRCYWSMEDASGATVLASAVPGMPDLRISGTPSLAAYSGIPGTPGIPTFTAASWVVSPIISNAPNDGAMFWRFVINVPSAPSATTSILTWQTTGTVKEFDLSMATDGSMQLIAYSATSTVLGATGSIAFGMAGARATVSVEVSNNASGGVDVLLFVRKLTSDTTTNTGQISTTTFASCTVGALTLVGLGIAINTGGLTGMSIGHLAMGSAQTFMFNMTSVLTAWYGENARTRWARLLAEDGVQYYNLSSTGNSLDVMMGKQASDTTINHLRKCELACFGLMTDGLSSGPSLATGSSMYNQTRAITFTATATKQGLMVDAGGLFQPVADDQNLVNRATVTREGGSTYTVDSTDPVLGTPTGGGGNIDIYSGGPGSSVNLAYDYQAYNYAAFYARIGTVNDFRYPTLKIDMRKCTAAQIQQWVWVLPGNLLAITNPQTYAAQLPPPDIEMIIRGWSESLSRFEWEVGINGTPALAWQVWQVQNSQWGRLAPVGMTVAEDVAVGASTIKVTSATGSQLFTSSATYPGDFPLQLNINGLAITVTASSIVSATNQTLTVDPTTVDLPILAGSVVRMWRGGVIAF